MAARKLAELIGGKGKIAMVQHMPGSNSTMDREAGFEDVIKKDFPRIRDCRPAVWDGQRV